MALYISKYNMEADKFLIASTENNKTTIATREHLIKALNSGMIIHGAKIIQGNLMAKLRCKSTVLLDGLAVGMPVRYKIQGLDWKHAILAGKKRDTYWFIDDSSTFQFSYDYLHNNRDRVIISDIGIDPVSIMKIRKAHKMY